MPISIFNPSCPHADPVVGGMGQGQRCGNCICVPRYWLLSVTVDSGAGPQLDRMSGKYVLRRDLAAFNSDMNQNCEWNADVDLREYDGDQDRGIWRLFYSGGTGSQSQLWKVWGIMYHDDGTAIVQYLYLPTPTPDAPHGKPWQCLSFNTLGIDPSQSFPGFPPTIIIQPFWP